jgi:hypothetical protein
MHATSPGIHSLHPASIIDSLELLSTTNMANNDDNSRRDRDRLEDNPFIAFRRFADSHVSSLLNTVFTLPATIASYNNVHQAREACLFKKSDNTQCDELRRIEGEIEGLRHHGQELYKAGEQQQLLSNAVELLRLDRHADELRKDIVGQDSVTEANPGSKELVQRVANQKGQEWGWDWSWGFPKPFDDDTHAEHLNTDPAKYQEQQLQSLRQVQAEAKRIFGEEAWTEATSTMASAMDSNPMFRSMVGPKEWDEFRKFLEGDGHLESRRRFESEEWQGTNSFSHANSDKYSPRALESDEEMRKTGVNWSEAWKELVRTEQTESQPTPREKRGRWRTTNEHQKRVPWADEDTNDEPSYEYAHDHEDQHDDPPTPKANQAKFPAPLETWNKSSQCTRSSDDQDIKKYLSEQLQQGRQFDLRGPDELQIGRTASGCAMTSDDEDIQKYISEQQQQGAKFGLRSSEESQNNGQCPRPSDDQDIQKYISEQLQRGRQFGLQASASSDVESTETELDAYDHLLTKPSTSAVAKANPFEEASSRLKPSILSTLTTTERSVAPDGSVTTKVVLKKRFADGREESSETVHTQRGQNMDRLRDQWSSNSAAHVGKPAATNEDEKKRGGWFWSN